MEERNRFMREREREQEQVQGPKPEQLLFYLAQSVVRGSGKQDIIRDE